MTYINNHLDAGRTHEIINARKKEDRRHRQPQAASISVTYNNQYQIDSDNPNVLLIRLEEIMRSLGNNEIKIAENRATERAVNPMFNAIEAILEDLIKVVVFSLGDANSFLSPLSKITDTEASKSSSLGGNLNSQNIDVLLQSNQLNNLAVLKQNLSQALKEVYDTVLNVSRLMLDIVGSYQAGGQIVKSKVREAKEMIKQLLSIEPLLVESEHPASVAYKNALNNINNNLGMLHKES